MNIDAIELGSAVDQIIHAGGCAPMLCVTGIGFEHYLVVALGESLQFPSGDRSAYDGKTVAMQSFEGPVGQSRACGH